MEKCVYSSPKKYKIKEASNIHALLLKNNIPCDDIITNIIDENNEEYLLYLDPNFLEKAENIMGNKEKQELRTELLEIKRGKRHNKKNVFNQNEKKIFYLQSL